VISFTHNLYWINKQDYLIFNLIFNKMVYGFIFFFSIFQIKNSVVEKKYFLFKENLNLERGYKIKIYIFNN